MFNVLFVSKNDYPIWPFRVLHRYYYWLLYPVVFLLLPINAPVEYWGESIMNSVFILGFLRYAIVLHASWFINSGALVWGLKPGDKLVVLLLLNPSSKEIKLFWKVITFHQASYLNTLVSYRSFSLITLIRNALSCVSFRTLLGYQSCVFCVQVPSWHQHGVHPDEELLAAVPLPASMRLQERRIWIIW